MKRTITLLVSLLVLTALLLSGCQQQGQAIPSDPVEAVKLIIDKQKDIKTQHTALDLKLALKVDGLPSDDPSAAFLKNFKASAQLEGDQDNATSDFSLKGTADLGVLTAFLSQGAEKLEFELVKVGETLYSRLADQDWNETPMSATGSGGAAPAADVAKLTEQMRDLLKKAAKAERLGDEQVSGVDTYHFKVTLDAIELISGFAAIAEETGGEAIPADQLDQVNGLLKDTDMILEMWVGKADLYIRKTAFQMTLDLKNIPDAPGVTMFLDLGLTVTNSKLNEPVTIAKPK